MKRFTIAFATLLATGASTLAQDQGLQVQPPAQDSRSPSARTSADAADDFAMAKRTQKATDLMNKKVVNTSGEDLGKLEDIVVDAQSGRILYGVLSFGGFLGMGDKLFAIPWGSLELPTDAKSFTLSVSKDRLKAAEGFDKGHWPNFADEQWATKTYKYYDQAPYWQVSDANPTDNNKNRMGGTYRERWYQRTGTWQKASDLSGKDCHNMQNEDIGRISDLIIDPDRGRLLYGVLQGSGKRMLVPWSAIVLSGDAKKFQIDITKEQLKSAPSFTGDDWPNVTDERWADDVHRYYHVQPYWSTRTQER